MATETRAKTTAVVPEVDVLSDIHIQRVDGVVIMTFLPAAKVMEADGTTQKKNAIGEPVHRRADVPPYGIIVNLNTQAGVDRIKAMEFGALQRLVAASRTYTGTDAEVTGQMLQAGQGVQWAMTQEAETLKLAMLARWDELVAAGDSDPMGTVEGEYGVRIDQGPNGTDGPFRLP